MRNLKKILALVLALVMSLSLMVTASAADFTDKADIDATGYQTAVDVLADLGVIKGYTNGSFMPNGDITRAEVAAIMYRIDAKDVTDAQVGIYTSWGKFPDVPDAAWFAGYVNYCANAEIVKGAANGSYLPQENITGYQVLAMALRALGYGKNGEYTGASWAINTAADARRLGIIDNVMEQKLGGSATRAFVAEVVFQTLLKETVTTNAVTGYVPTGKTLGQTQFGLERISGVVVANEYADLESSWALGTGKTRLQVGDKSYTLNVATDLTDIGESRYAYVQPDGKRGYNLLVSQLYDTGANVAPENNGDAVKVRNLAASEGLGVTGAEYFLNFEGTTQWTSDYKLKYVMKYSGDTNGQEAAQADADEINDSTGIESGKKGYVAVSALKGTAPNQYYEIERVIERGDTIYQCDYYNMRHIFGVADKTDDDDRTSFEDGEIYVGTQSTKDISDDPDYSWTIFEDKFLDPDENAANYDSVKNGTWLKIVDNNNDGVADYVFATVYSLAETTGYNNRDGYYVYSSKAVTNWVSDGYVGYVGDYEPAVGDMVLAAFIDGTYLMEEAPAETRTIKTVNYKKTNIVTTEDETWDQSGMTNLTGYADDITDMGEKTEYEIFFDHFGHVIAYRPAKATADYALLTEVYEETDRNGGFVKNARWIAEVTVGEADTEEYYISNVDKSGNNDLLGSRWNNDFETVISRTGVRRPNYLQRAIAHLAAGEGLHTDSWASHPSGGLTFYPGNEFQWGTDTTSAGTNQSRTNIAKYALDGDDVALESAAEYACNRKGEQLYYYNGGRVTEAEWLEANPGCNSVDFKKALTAGTVEYAYSVDYIQLKAESLKGNTKYTVDPSYSGHLSGNQYVNAVHDTAYYVVDFQGEAIDFFTDYTNLYSIPAGNIRAVYAVAENTAADNSGNDYWVADVIVIELSNSLTNGYDSISLAYYNPEKSTGKVKSLDTLNNKHEGIEATVISKKEGWAGQWADYGFYGLMKTETEDDTITAADIDKILEGSYNANGIYAGTVTREKKVSSRGDYIMVDNGTDDVAVYVKDAPFYSVHSKKGSLNYAADVLNDGEIETGDKIIWVMNRDNVTFVVDASFDNGDPKNWSSPNWLAGIWDEILREQTTEDTVDLRLTFSLAAAETAEVKGAKYINDRGVVDDTLTQATQTAPSVILPIPADKTNVVTFEVKLSAGAAIAVGYPIGTDWTVVKVEQISVADNTWKVTILNNGTQTASLMPDEGAKVVIATGSGWDAFLAEANTVITAQSPAETVELIRDILNTVAKAGTAVKNFTSAQESALTTAVANVDNIGAADRLAVAKEAAREALEAFVEPMKENTPSGTVMAWVNNAYEGDGTYLSLMCQGGTELRAFYNNYVSSINSAATMADLDSNVAAAYSVLTTQLGYGIQGGLNIVLQNNYDCLQKTSGKVTNVGANGTVAMYWSEKISKAVNDTWTATEGDDVASMIAAYKTAFAVIDSEIARIIKENEDGGPISVKYDRTESTDSGTVYVFKAEGSACANIRVFNEYCAEVWDECAEGKATLVASLLNIAKMLEAINVKEGTTSSNYTWKVQTTNAALIGLPGSGTSTGTSTGSFHALGYYDEFAMVFENNSPILLEITSKMGNTENSAIKIKIEVGTVVLA